MRIKTWAAGAGALLALGAISTWSLAADHIDGPAPTNDPAADITDLYSWMSPDGNKVIFALNVVPFAANESKFSDKVQYVIHTRSYDKFGGTAAAPTNIICTFDAKQVASCWVGTADYVTGDASATAGLSSTSGKVKVFAGLRDDPFFFNLEGFNDTIAAVKGAAGGLQFDAAGCPALDATTSSVLVGMLKGTKGGTAAAADFFASKNVLSIVLEVDKSLLTTGGPMLSVWASTNKAGG